MPTTHWIRNLTLLGAMSAVTACAAPDLDAAAAHEAAALDRFSVIVLDGTRVAGLPHADDLDASAYFIEHSGDRAATLRLLNVHPAAWLDALPTDSCVVQERDLRSAEAPEAAGPVRLLDAGELQLRSAAGDIAFDSHYFPDVYPDVGGIAYDTALARVRHVADGTVTVAADGSDELGEVSISATMPAAMGLERVGGEAVVDGHVAAHASPAGDLDVAWSASRADASQDVVLVSYVRRGFDRVASIYCAVSDDGAFAVPAAAMALLPDLGGEHTDRLAVERVRSVSFTAPGMPDGLMLLIAGDAAYVE
ncbi:MAG: hypothetical protein KC635_16320 [Myxococcales bacterium]|nr:hypothetical protein [Myxococcales bacterium]